MQAKEACLSSRKRLAREQEEERPVAEFLKGRLTRNIWLNSAVPLLPRSGKRWRRHTAGSAVLRILRSFSSRPRVRRSAISGGRPRGMYARRGARDARPQGAVVALLVGTTHGVLAVPLVSEMGLVPVWWLLWE